MITNKKSFFLFFLLLLTSFVPVKAQTDLPNQSVLFSSITINDGLSQGFIPCIFQDKKGFMWFATKDGLNKYDGYKFTVYRHDSNDSTTISDNFITQIYEDSSGFLWVGTSAGGVEIFNPSTESFYHLYATKNTETYHNLNSCIFITEDALKNIWLYAGGEYLIVQRQKKDNPAGDSFGEQYAYTISKGQDYLHQKMNLPDIYPSLLRLEENGDLWVKYDDSLYRATKAAQQNKESVNRYKETEFLPFNGCALKHILSGQENNLTYFISNCGIATFDRKQGKIIRSVEVKLNGGNFVNNCTFDKEDNLWIHYDQGLIYYMSKENKLANVIASNIEPAFWNTYPLQNVYCDRSGLIWIGTNGYGIYKYNPRTTKFHQVTGNDNYLGGVTGIHEDQGGRIFINSKRANQYFNLQEQKVEKEFFTRSMFIKERYDATIGPASNFVQDEKGIYWMPYGYGVLARYDEAKNTIKFFTAENAEDDISASNIWIDKEQKIWITRQNIQSEYFICTFDPVTETFGEAILLPEKVKIFSYPFVSQVIVRADGAFWFATLQGLFLYHPKEKTWQHYKNIPGNKNTLSYDILFSICEDPFHPEKYLWIGTNSSGLNRLDIQKGTFIRYTDKDGLPNNVIYGILSDRKGNLWMSTNKGICRFNPESKECMNYYASDGLQSNEFNRYAFLKSKTGNLFFGGVNGFNYFNPDEINSKQFPPDIAFTGFRLFNKNVSYNDPLSPVHAPIDNLSEIRLSYDQSMITIEFAAMDYAAPEKNLYKYRLEGFDKDWISSDNNHEATYTNLDPGEYVFWVKAANSEGIWNETGRKILITITPPWWQTIWARIFFTVAGIGIVLVIIRIRTSGLRNNKKILENKVEARTRELNKSLLDLKQTQEQLVRQEKLASLGHLTAGIAHEIKNPLNFVNNFSALSKDLLKELAEARTEEEKAEITTTLSDNLDKIEHHGQRADKIVKSMLDHSRDNGSEKQNIDINALAEEYFNLAYQGMRASHSDFQCEMHRELTSETPLVFGLVQDLSRVLLNLFSNAFYAVHQRSKNNPGYVPSVSLRTEWQYNNILIHIRDNGGGIPEELKEKIFEPFFTTKPSGEGTGLGLSLSYDIIKAQGGELKAVSVKNDFTEFTITLSAGM